MTPYRSRSRIAEGVRRFIISLHPPRVPVKSETSGVPLPIHVSHGSGCMLPPGPWSSARLASSCATTSSLAPLKTDNASTKWFMNNCTHDAAKASVLAAESLQ
ncbi:hypothetical protein HAX54_044753 [Datura stramonium]|uniref:Uncharacterized protein n=1 Tax=Datura stramonium TaxID=4076 RepID=A0ABS8WJ21_DATST|nr:hypothetical protein [Datura stramonium]